MATYKKYATKNGTPIQVQSAIEDGAGKDIENNYAKQDGYYGEMTSGYADNLTPYSADSGVYQSIPFNFQGTGCGNGETQVDTGSFAYLREKRGNGIVYNQLLPISDIGNETYNGITFTNNNDGSWTINGTATGNAYRKVAPSQSSSISYIAGHKYLLFGNRGGSSSTFYLADNYGGNYVHQDYGKGVIFTATEVKANIFIRVLSGTTVNNIKIVPKLIDLTKWFNGNIPQYLLDHPESFFRYYSGDLSYNVGETKFSNARYLTTIGRNQWDEEYTAGGWINGNGTIGTGYANRFCSKNFIRVDPNTEYYFRVPYSASDYGIRIGYYDSAYNVIKVQTNYGARTTMPANCIYIKFATTQNYGSTTYNNDVTISIYYDGESGYDRYYPYEVLQTIDTGAEQLYAAGLAYDRKEPSGLTTRNIGTVDLGSLNYTLIGLNFISGIISDIKIPATTTTVANITCSLYNAVDIAKTFVELDFAINQEGKLYIRNTAYSDAATFKSAMSGVILYYELDTPTTEQGTPFTENVKIDDFGSMSLESANGVPQGNLIFYPVDYKAFVDTLVNYTDGDATSLAKKSDIVQELPEVPSTNGNYRLRCTVADGVATYTWVEES